MPYDYDGRWHPETDGFEMTSEDYRAHVWRLVRWAIYLVAMAIVLTTSYNADLLKNERPDHLAPVTTEIAAPGQG